VFTHLAQVRNVTDVITFAIFVDVLVRRKNHLLLFRRLAPHAGRVVP
jgi:hypothetical protein